MKDVTDLVALPVASRTEAEAFIRKLNECGLMHHFDDGAVDCLFGNDLVSKADAERIDQKVDACYVAWRASGADMQNDCPIGYALDVMNGTNDNPPAPAETVV